jgi:hypothetical protein
MKPIVVEAGINGKSRIHHGRSERTAETGLERRELPDRPSLCSNIFLPPRTPPNIHHHVNYYSHRFSAADP